MAGSLGQQGKSVGNLGQQGKPVGSLGQQGEVCVPVIGGYSERNVNFSFRAPKESHVKLLK